MTQLGQAATPYQQQYQSNQTPKFGDEIQHVKTAQELGHTVEEANHPWKNALHYAIPGAFEGAMLGGIAGGLPGAAIGALGLGGVGAAAGLAQNKKHVQDTAYDANMADKVALANNQVFNNNTGTMESQINNEYNEKYGQQAPKGLIALSATNAPQRQQQAQVLHDQIKNSTLRENYDAQQLSLKLRQEADARAQDSGVIPGAPVTKSSLKLQAAKGAPVPQGSQSNPVQAGTSQYGPNQIIDPLAAPVGVFTKPSDQAGIQNAVTNSSESPSKIAQQTAMAGKSNSEIPLNNERTKTERTRQDLNRSQSTAALAKANYDRVNALWHPALVKSQINKNNADAKKTSQPSSFQEKLNEVQKMGNEGILDTSGQNTIRAGLAGQLKGKGSINIYNVPKGSIVEHPDGSVWVKDPSVRLGIRPAVAGQDYTPMIFDPASQAFSAVSGGQ